MEHRPGVGERRNMKEYHKIKTLFKRDPETNYKTLINDEYSFPEFEYLANNRWVFTEKVHGMNIRIIYHDVGNLSLRGKSDAAELPRPLVHWFQTTILPQRETFEDLFDDGPVCLYGEGYGGKIQKGGAYRPDQSFVLFDILIGGWWLRREDVETIGRTLGLDVVPIVAAGTLFDMVSIVRNGFGSFWNNDLIAEGLVARPAVEMRRRNGNRVITKLKYKDFHPDRVS